MSASVELATSAPGPPPGLSEIEARIETLRGGAADPVEAVNELVRLGEQVFEHWLIAHGREPTADTHEGFRLLALHRQGAKGDPSFNACRETARELAYHCNLIRAEPDHPETAKRLALASMVAAHLYLFVSGKLEVAGLGEFCCSSRPLRSGGG